MKIALIIIALILTLGSIIVINAVRCKNNGRKLGNEKNYYNEEQQLECAKKFSQILQCKTISHRESYCDTEFAKLRDVMKELFPLFHQQAELQIFSDDCWVYKIPGKDQTRNIMVMSHHDVVKADGEWKYGAFSGEIAEGRIWGRGAVDTKGPLFAECEAIEDLLAEGFVPACNVYIASSHNEETSGDGIPLAKEYFIANNITFELIIDEGGAILEAPMGGINCKCAMIAVHEKGRHALNCVAAIPALHASLKPNVETPIARMSKFIAEVSSKNIFIRRIYPETHTMFESLCPYMTFPMRLVFANLWLFSPLLNYLIPKISDKAGAMLGTSCSFTSISGGRSNPEKSNECTSVAMLRCVDINDFEQDLRVFKRIAQKYDITLSEAESGNGFYPPSDINQHGYQYVRKCINDIFPHLACAPFILSAGTDARHFTDVCDSVIRFAPIDISNEQLSAIHGVDENINIKAIANAVVFYKHLIKNYK